MDDNVCNEHASNNLNKLERNGRKGIIMMAS